MDLQNCHVGVTDCCSIGGKNPVAVMLAQMMMSDQLQSGHAHEVNAPTVGGVALDSGIILGR